MKSLLLLLVCLTSLALSAQEDEWEWWNEIHGWEEGDPGWRNMMILSPGFLGPNGLPVPEVKKGYLTGETEMEITVSRHFHPADPTQDLSARFYLPFCDHKIALEGYGVLLENYQYSEDIRNARFSRDKDGRGIVPGDLYLSALIQLSRDRAFPNTLARLAFKTASGDAFAARYTDTPGYFFDLSASRDFELDRNSTLRPYVDLGFYSWQTYLEDTPQNDAFYFGGGVEFRYRDWSLSGTYSGYSGYLESLDRPRVITFDTRYDWTNSAARLQFVYGLRDWVYQTFRFSYIVKLRGL